MKSARFSLPSCPNTWKRPTNNSNLGIKPQTGGSFKVTILTISAMDALLVFNQQVNASHLVSGINTEDLESI